MLRYRNLAGNRVFYIGRARRAGTHEVQRRDEGVTFSFRKQEKRCKECSDTGIWPGLIDTRKCRVTFKRRSMAYVEVKPPREAPVICAQFDPGRGNIGPQTETQGFDERARHGIPCFLQASG